MPTIGIPSVTLVILPGVILQEGKCILSVAGTMVGGQFPFPAMAPAPSEETPIAAHRQRPFSASAKSDILRLRLITSLNPYNSICFTLSASHHKVVNQSIPALTGHDVLPAAGQSHQSTLIYPS
ncbi:hypothetical protein BDW75DRAFT_222906 [Aspergillus navahoensis]